MVLPGVIKWYWYWYWYYPSSSNTAILAVLLRRYYYGALLLLPGMALASEKAWHICTGDSSSPASSMAVPGVTCVRPDRMWPAARPMSRAASSWSGLPGGVGGWVAVGCCCCCGRMGGGVAARACEAVARLLGLKGRGRHWQGQRLPAGGKGAGQAARHQVCQV